MELNSAEIERTSALLRSPETATAEDARLLEKIVAQYPFFAPGHLLLSAVKKTRSHAEKASIYTNGQLSRRFYEMPVRDEAEEIYDEIAELDIPHVQASAALAPDIENIPAEELEEEKELEVAAPNEPGPVFFVPEIETVTPDEPEHAQVSKYDDDKLPYSFLWWLAKTRAEYEPIFQPYAAPVHQQKGDLQQQYVEHIFHLQTGVGLDGNGAIVQSEAPTGKNLEIIEAFLSSDAQIKPPPHNKLDNENKARKSAEDHNDVVSETLAAIYIEQALYRKAIDTYEKLSLKFPEKSRYFADLIKSLEKKI